MGKGWKQQNACHQMESDSWICLPQDRTGDVIALLFLADDKGVMWCISRSRAVWQVSETLRVFWFSCINQLGQFSRRICFKAIMSSSYFPAIFISIFDKSGVRGNPEPESLPFPTSNKCMHPPLNENNNNKVNDNTTITTILSSDLSHYYWWYLDLSDKWATSPCTRVNFLFGATCDLHVAQSFENIFKRVYFRRQHAFIGTENKTTADWPMTTDR